MKALVDTNVLFDYFARRHPFDRVARLLLFGCAMGDYELWISSSQVTDLHYLLTHGDERASREEAVQRIKHLHRFVRIGSLTEADVEKALDADWPDFEDSCVYFVARHLDADYLITRNASDFAKAREQIQSSAEKRGSALVVSPDEFLAMLQRERGISYDEIAW